MPYFITNTADNATRIMSMSFNEGFFFGTFSADFTILVCYIVAPVTLRTVYYRLTIHDKLRATNLT